MCYMTRLSSRGVGMCRGGDGEKPKENLASLKVWGKPWGKKVIVGGVLSESRHSPPSLAR